MNEYPARNGAVWAWVRAEKLERSRLRAGPVLVRVYTRCVGTDGDSVGGSSIAVVHDNCTVVDDGGGAMTMTDGDEA